MKNKKKLLESKLKVVEKEILKLTKTKEKIKTKIIELNKLTCNHKKRFITTQYWYTPNGNNYEEDICFECGKTLSTRAY